MTMPVVDPDVIDFDVGTMTLEINGEVVIVSFPSISTGELIEIGRLYSDGSFDCWLDPAPWSILSELRSQANRFREFLAS